MDYNGANGFEFGAGNTNIDPAVQRELPEGCKVVSIENHGVSFWAKTGRINILLNDGTPQSYFIKVISKELGMKFIPRPIACGTYQTISDTHFFLCEFREMTEDMPDPHKFAALLSRLHQKSVSPTGKFGFHVTNYAGNLPQFVAWEDSWETFFAKSMRQALDLEIESKGPSEELEILSQALFEKVIPRLLRPLESGGRTVKPSLVHGDLWYANSGIDVDNDQPLVFDACCFFAHNEYEFGQWRPACNRFGDEYVAAYNTFAQISPPEEDFEGRLDLYRLVLDVMRDLVQRYADANGATMDEAMETSGEACKPWRQTPGANREFMCEYLRLPQCSAYSEAEPDSNTKKTDNDLNEFEYEDPDKEVGHRKKHVGTRGKEHHQCLNVDEPIAGFAVPDDGDGQEEDVQGDDGEADEPEVEGH
ncbi:hypothetical protein HG530_011293 [Fusarium avenaceum]|nr:hypothetical protein HG530_011293 [Fusarium avenaceum]